MTKKDTLNFEVSLEKLEKIITKLEDGDISLEDSVKSFEEGIGLVKECQKQSSNMRAIHIRVGHDYDFMIAQLFDIKFIATDPRPKGHHKISNFLTVEHAVKTRALDV